MSGWIHRQLDTPYGRVERRERHVARQHIGAGQPVEQGRLAGIGVADQRDHRRAGTHPALALEPARAAHILKIDHLFRPGLELHRQLRPVDLLDKPIAELVMKDALADGKAAVAAGGGDEGGFAFEGSGGFADAGAGVLFQALPAGGGIGRALAEDPGLAGQ